jgi:hypothetical protein
MSVIINIKGTPIVFPSTGESPNWAPAITEFAEATASAIDSAVGPYDVSPTVLDITAANIGTTFNINELSFSTAVVRSVVISYSIILNKSSGTNSESGTVYGYYDINNTPNWTVVRDYIGETYSTINIANDGDVELTISNSYGYTSGKISFSAKSLEQT